MIPATLAHDGGIAQVEARLELRRLLQCASREDGHGVLKRGARLLVATEVYGDTLVEAGALYPGPWGATGRERTRQIIEGTKQRLRRVSDGCLDDRRRRDLERAEENLDAWNARMAAERKKEAKLAAAAKRYAKQREEHERAQSAAEQRRLEARRQARDWLETPFADEHITTKWDALTWEALDVIEMLGLREEAAQLRFAVKALEAENARLLAEWP